MKNRAQNIVEVMPQDCSARASAFAGAKAAGPFRAAPFRIRRSGGGAVIEAVLVLSLILMLTLGAGEYGYAFYLKHALQSAAAVGVRTAILQNSTDAAVQTAITNQLALTNMQNIPYTLTKSPTSVTGCAAGTYVTVTLSVTWGNIGISPLPVSMGGFPASKIFSSAASMVHE